MSDVGFAFLVTFIKFVFVMITIGWIPALIAKKKGRNFFPWWIYGGALFIIALIHALVMKPRSALDAEDALVPHEWYYLAEEHSHGPILVDGLRELYQKGEIGDMTTIWRNKGLATFLKDSPIYAEVLSKQDTGQPM
jgi:hypothetical protein